MKTIVVGLGNPILGDDGVGWQIASKLREMHQLAADVTVENLAIGGISLMEALIGYDRAIIIDSIVTLHAPIGKVTLFNLNELPNPASGHTASAHDTSLKEALLMGRSLGAHLPELITIVTVESQHVYEFSEDLTPAVAKAIPEAVGIVLDLLIESRSETTSETSDLKS